MNDRVGLVQAISDNPEDDVPRLVYADWLEEHGEAQRGQLGRLQCRRAADEGEAGVLGEYLKGLEGWERSDGFLQAACAEPADGSHQRKRRAGTAAERKLLRAHG